MAKNKKKLNEENIKLTKKEKQLSAFLQKFTIEIAKSINSDMISEFQKLALTIKGPLMKSPTIQINVSDDLKNLTAIWREADDTELKKSYIEIDLLSDKYPKTSSTKKLLKKYKKNLKTIEKNS